MKRVRLFLLSMVVCSAFFMQSCDDDPKPIDVPHDSPELKKAKEDFVKNYVDIVQASYDDALAKTKDLQTAIHAFVASPDQAKFDAAKAAWKASREPYGQTEGYRFYGGPIDKDDGNPENYINAWPLDEALIDYVRPGSGGQLTGDLNQNIVNNTVTFPKIDKAALRGHFFYVDEKRKEDAEKKEGVEFDNEANVTLGYHAIEFLLWGQDFKDATNKKAGQRPYTDYTTKSHFERRKQYLKLATDMLVEELQKVVAQWETNGQYRKTFLALPKNEAIGKILTGIGTLSKGELAGERMSVAVADQTQEQEHSCFSDNTNRDVYLNAESINNVIEGKYKKLDGTKMKGTSLLDVLKLSKNPKAGTDLKATADDVMKKMKYIADHPPFDFLIIGETLDNTTGKVMAGIYALRKQGNQISEAAKVLTGSGTQTVEEDSADLDYKDGKNTEGVPQS